MVGNFFDVGGNFFDKGGNFGISGQSMVPIPTTNVPQHWNVPSVVKVDKKEITLKENQK